MHLKSVLHNITPLRWRHNDHAGVSNHQPHGCLLNRLFRRKSKKTSKLRVTGLCAGNSPGTGEFPAQMASNAENVSIWWRHHDMHQLLSNEVNKITETFNQIGLITITVKILYSTFRRRLCPYAWTTCTMQSHYIEYVNILKNTHDWMMVSPMISI